MCVLNLTSESLNAIITKCVFIDSRAFPSDREKRDDLVCRHHSVKLHCSFSVTIVIVPDQVRIRLIDHLCVCVCVSV